MLRADCGRCHAVCFPAFVPFGVRAPGAAEVFEFAVLACGSFDPFVAVGGAGVGPGAAGLHSGGSVSVAPARFAAAFFGARRLAAAAFCRSLSHAFAPT